MTDARPMLSLPANCADANPMPWPRSTEAAVKPPEEPKEATPPSNGICPPPDDLALSHESLIFFIFASNVPLLLLPPPPPPGSPRPMRAARAPISAGSVQRSPFQEGKPKPMSPLAQAMSRSSISPPPRGKPPEVLEPQPHPCCASASEGSLPPASAMGPPATSWELVVSRFWRMVQSVFIPEGSMTLTGTFRPYV